MYSLVLHDFWYTCYLANKKVKSTPKKLGQYLAHNFGEVSCREPVDGCPQQYVNVSDFAVFKNQDTLNIYSLFFLLFFTIFVIQRTASDNRNPVTRFSVTLRGEF